MIHLVWLHVLELTGTLTAASKAYNFWSGFGSDLGELAVIGGLAAMVRRHNCEVRGCWRLGRHATAAGHHVCRRHHPDGHLTPEAVREQHAMAMRRGDG